MLAFTKIIAQTLSSAHYKNSQAEKAVDEIQTQKSYFSSVFGACDFHWTFSFFVGCRRCWSLYFFADVFCSSLTFSNAFHYSIDAIVALFVKRTVAVVVIRPQNVVVWSKVELDSSTCLEVSSSEMAVCHVGIHAKFSSEREISSDLLVQFCIEERKGMAKLFASKIRCW